MSDPNWYYDYVYLQPDDDDDEERKLSPYQRIKRAQNDPDSNYFIDPKERHNDNNYY